MNFDKPLTKAILQRRYKRFLADVILENGESVTVHCPNTGSMRNCVVEQSSCWLSHSSNPKRKYAFTWEIATTPSGALACINTHQANRVIKEALIMKHIPTLADYQKIHPEVKYGQRNSRIDFLLQEGLNHQPDCYVEAKSVTLEGKEGCGFFPDAKSQRAIKHLHELMYIKSQGNRAVLVFCVMHTGIQTVSPAEHIDCVYARTLKEAREAGVEILAVGCDISDRGICVNSQKSVDVTY